MFLVSRKNVGLELIYPYPYFSARLKRKLVFLSFRVFEEGRECCCFREPLCIPLGPEFLLFLCVLLTSKMMHWEFD